MKVTLILPVRNEESSIARVLECIAGQSRLPDEIIIADGGSTDRTVAIIESYRERLPLRVLEIGPAFPGKGRNRAIAEAAHEIVALTDAGIRLAPDWLAAVTAPFARDPGLEVVFGGYRPVCGSAFLRATALFVACDKSPEYGFRFPVMPSMAIKKELYLKLGGCPEQLRAAEDSVFFRRLFEYGARFAVAKQAVVEWEMEGSWRYLVRKCFHAAKYEILGGYLRKRSLILWGVYPCLSVLALLALWLAPLLALALPVLFAARVTGSRRMDPELYRSLVATPSGLCWLALVTLVADLAHLVGNLAGLFLYLKLRDRPRLRLWRGARFQP